MEFQLPPPPASHMLGSPDIVASSSGHDSSFLQTLSGPHDELSGPHGGPPMMSGAGPFPPGPFGPGMPHPGPPFG